MATVWQYAGMIIIVSGTHGLIGKKLVSELFARGHAVKKLVRTPATKPEEIFWNPDTGDIEAQKLEGADAIIHLAGSGIANGLWTASRKEYLMKNRVGGAETLSRTIANLTRKPKTFIVASAVGYYGNGPEKADETSPKGLGFAADLCAGLERATHPAVAAGIRTVQARFGIVLSPEGGMLWRLLWPFKFGLGGAIGNGTQMISWVSLTDAIGALLHILQTENVAGPVNIVAPQTTSNQTFVRTLGTVLVRPSFIPLPSIIVQKVFGQMGEELLLGGRSVAPAALQASGFTFKHPTLEKALRAELATE